MILTDGIHLISTDSARELHSFAASIGLKRCWYEGARKGHPHYDLPRYLRNSNAALSAGAIKVSSREIVLKNHTSPNPKDL